MKILKISLTVLLLLVMQVSIAQKDKEAKEHYKNAQKSFRKEQYLEAFTDANLALNGKLKKNHRTKLIEEYTSAFNSYYGASLTHINELESRSTEYYGEPSILNASALIKSYTELSTVTQLVGDLNDSELKELNIKRETLIDYQPEIDHANGLREKYTAQFVAEQYELGVKHLGDSTKKKAYISHGHFSNVVKYDPSYKDVSILIEKAYKKATYRVKINSFQNRIKGTEGLNFANVGSNELNAELAKLCQSNIFLTLIYEGDEDIAIYIDLTNHKKTVAEIYPDKNERTKKIVVKEEEVKKDDGSSEKVKIYDEVKGTFTTYSQEYWLNLDGKMKIYNHVSGEILNESNIGGYTRKTNYWYGFTGDDRVLDKYEKADIKKKKPAAPADTILFEDASRQLASSTAQIIYKQLQTLF